MYRLHGAIHAYGGTTVSARDTADSVITALTPAAWYRNATGVTSAGGFASQWDDYSGNTRHLVQATGTNQPAYAAGVFTFDGADNYLKTSAFTLNQPETLYLVANPVSWTLNDYICDGNADNTMAIRQTPTTPDFVGRVGGLTTNVNSGWAVGAFSIVCVVYNGASSVTRVNNNAAGAGSVATTAAGGFTLGCNGWTGVHGNVAVKEAIIFPAAHDDTTRSSVITALNNALTVF